jgi:hypothetical protein
MTIIRVDKNQIHDVFIGRPSRYSNPFIKGEDGTRQDVIRQFEEYLRKHPERDKMLDELEGKRIACWCKTSERCHGDIYIQLAEERRKLLFLNGIIE